jgi:hypothetical protein
MGDRFGWLDGEFEIVKKEPKNDAQRPSTTGVSSSSEDRGVCNELEEAYQDPESGDQNDPAYQQEMCQMFKNRGWTPEQLTSAFWREFYRRWLEGGN